MLQISLLVYNKFLVAMIVILVNFLVMTVGKLDGKFFCLLLLLFIINSMAQITLSILFIINGNMP